MRQFAPQKKEASNWTPVTKVNCCVFRSGSRHSIATKMAGIATVSLPVLIVHKHCQRLNKRHLIANKCAGPLFEVNFGGASCSP